MGTPPAPAVPGPDLRVRVPLPAGTQSVSAVVHDPERPQPVPLPCAFREGRCELTLSGLRIYQVVEIRVR